MTGNIQIDQLVRTLLQKESLEQCSLQELEQFAGRHPYFGAAQLLLAKKMQLENSDGYQEQLQKTYLFFHNPLWVHRLLGETEQVPPEMEQATETEQAADVPRSDIVDTTTEVSPPVAEAPAEIVSPAPEETVAMPEEMRPETVQPADPVAENPSEAVKEDNGGANNDALVFEPYHTVDYFASQGIRYKPEDKPQDKFGRQLKSFTDWLKVMKRLPATEIAAGTEPAAEKKVEQMAERSLQEKDVVTEAMADVWIKQGNRERAREIYRKLSLLDPSKSAYFASKIEELQ
jgi:hypothetical protein